MSIELVDRYFALAPSHDREAYFALFADDAIALDDGHTYVGIEAIRSWRAEVPPVTYTRTDVSEVDGRLVATADIAGDFPGSPVALRFAFEFDDGVITRLVISP
ncbi:nuclear transport factor 2 family protein [Aeromicrobium sp. UC242_57]|uniref:nuclear transport factor 2 family protein n=1 Tax=Aeromicrobium sp. UC242_57 TaxID=3374624 RepID=UPI00379FA70B